jgi:hypothetical protein
VNRGDGGGKTPVREKKIRGRGERSTRFAEGKSLPQNTFDAVFTGYAQVIHRQWIAEILG